MGRPEELDERLAALDKAVELNPQCVDAYDLRALSLAAAGRREEAAAACRPAIFGDHQPAELRARGAWLAAERGDRATAIAEMRAVVAESPAVFDAWGSLHQWCHDAKDLKGSLEAAEAMVRIAPQYGVAYGCLGEARAACKDGKGAAAAYRLALEISPAYEFAANCAVRPANRRQGLEIGRGDAGRRAATLAIVLHPLARGSGSRSTIATAMPHARPSAGSA